VRGMLGGGFAGGFQCGFDLGVQVPGSFQKAGGFVLEALGTLDQLGESAPFVLFGLVRVGHARFWKGFVGVTDGGRMIRETCCNHWITGSFAGFELLVERNSGMGEDGYDRRG